MEQKYLDFAKNIAYKSGEIMIKYFKGDNEASYKFDQTIVTKADTEINQYLIKSKTDPFLGPFLLCFFIHCINNMVQTFKCFNRQFL